MKTRRTCAAGHVYFKSSDCPTCPRCEAERTPAAEFLRQIGAPARRALEREGLTSLAKIARRSESSLAELHGMGPKALGILRGLLKEDGRTFAKR